MENAPRAKPEDVREQYERQLKDLQQAYGESRAPEKLASLVCSYGLRQEFSPPHRPRPNGMIERVIRTLKKQCAHRHRFESQQHASRVIGDWIQFYNQRRPHAGITAQDGWLEGRRIPRFHTRHEKQGDFMDTSVIDSRRDNSAGRAAWICLAIAWATFIFPFPGIGLFIGWPLNFVAFILAIVAMSRSGAGAGIWQLLASLVASPVVYFIGLAVFAGLLGVAGQA